MLPVFWNGEEHRLRALWRILAQALLFFLGTIIFGAMLVATALGVASSRPSAPLLNPGDPAALAGLLGGQLGLLLLNAGAALLAAFSSVWLAGRFLDRRRFSDFGFHFSPHWWFDFVFGLVLGAVLILGIFVLELMAGWVTIAGLLEAGTSDMPFGWLALGGLVVFIIVGIEEELLSRGYQLRNIAEGLHSPRRDPAVAVLAAWVLSATIFGMLHAMNPNATILSTAMLVVAGLFLGLGYILTGELAIPIGLHITWNYFEGFVFGFPVSGIPPIASFIAIEQNGPEILTGGRFGPEAGLVGLVWTLAGGVLTALWVRYRYGSVRICHNISRYWPAKDKHTGLEC